MPGLGLDQLQEEAAARDCLQDAALGQDAVALLVGQRARSRTARGRTRSSPPCGSLPMYWTMPNQCRPASAGGCGSTVGNQREVDVVDREFAIAVDEVDAARADAVDRGNVQLHHLDMRRHGPGAALRSRADRPRAASRTRKATAAMTGVSTGCIAARQAGDVRVDDDVHVALAVEQHFARAMPRDRPEAHHLQHLAQRLRLARGVLDELDAVDAGGIDRTCGFRDLREVEAALSPER